MAWATKYRGEFTDLTYSGSTHGLLWTIHIEEDDYAGAINEMVMAGQPLVIEHLTPSDDLILGTIKGSKATISVISETNFQYTGLYSSENFKYRVSIYYGVGLTLYWRGFLTTEYSEPYDDIPYTVSITANDGLGLLKSLSYDNDGTVYTGRATEALVITRILTKMGFTAWKEYVNVYDTLMAATIDDSPFDQCQVEQDAFLDNDFEAMSCYDVLTEILKKYNAVIRQVNGEMVIYRPLELTGSTVYGRSFTAYDTKTSVTITPQQLIDRTGYSSSVYDYNGGVLGMASPISKFTADQDYGSRESWIDNHNFNIKTWLRTATPQHFNYWDHLGGQPISYEPGLEGEKEGIEMMPDGTGSNYYAVQEFGTYAKVCSDVFVFSFDYRLIKPTGLTATNVTFKIILADSTFTYYLNDADDEVNTTASWGTTYHTIERLTASVDKGLGSWVSVTYTIEGLPIAGPYKIYLFATDTVGVRIAYKNVRFYSTSDAYVSMTKKMIRAWKYMSQPWVMGMAWIWSGPYKNVTNRYLEDAEEIVSRTYEAVNTGVNAPTNEQAYMLGDCENTDITNVIEQFKGSLCVSTVGSLSQTATDFVNSFAATYAALTSPGVTLTSSGDTLYFESDTAGTDFTGATTIVNASGDLAGTVTTIQANASAVAEVDTVKVNLTSPSGTANVTCKGLTKLMTYATNVPTTVAAFVSANQADYAAAGVTLAVHGSTTSWMTFTAAVAGGSFGSDTTIVNVTGTLSGTVENTTAPVFPQKRKDQIVLSGSSGTATITCHGEDNTATYNTGTVLDHTTAWSTRGGSEAKPIIELVADEIKTLYSRERHFIQMRLRETSVTAPDFNVLYNLQDSVNRYNNYIRIFAVNRGTLDVKKREWVVDVMEIGTRSEATYTADDDETTVDSTSITVDSD